MSGISEDLVHAGVSEGIDQQRDVECRRSVARPSTSAKPSNNDFRQPLRGQPDDLFRDVAEGQRDQPVAAQQGQVPGCEGFVRRGLHWLHLGSEPVSGTGTIITISEVYVRRCPDANDSPTPLQLARSGFHESMHNQLALGDELHKGSGFAGARMDGNSPSADNIAKMAAGLATLRPQWVEGFQAWKTNEETVH